MDSNGDLVLVTGATGYIARHCVVSLLEAGYRVRGTARSTERAARLAEQLRPHLSAVAATRLDSMEIVAADLLHDDGWPEAVSGCRHVLHVASPFPAQPPKTDDELIVPARDGALRVLREAAAGDVDRVVMTSSAAAVVSGHRQKERFDESDWSNLAGPGVGAYEKSKTIAERAAWDFIGNLEGPDPMELVVINPSVVIGPLLGPDHGTSAELLKKLFDRDFPAVPDLTFPVVDVRDVASAHLRALEVPEAAGNRFICSTANMPMRDIALLLERHFSELGFKIPTRRLPNVLFRLGARFDPTAKLAVHQLGRTQVLLTDRIERVLGWEPIDVERSIVEMGESLLNHGVVSAKA
jgi:dihydroflavonol-4-reductase